MGPGPPSRKAAIPPDGQRDTLPVVAIQLCYLPRQKLQGAVGCGEATAAGWDWHTRTILQEMPLCTPAPCGEKEEGQPMGQDRGALSILTSHKQPPSRWLGLQLPSATARGGGGGNCPKEQKGPRESGGGRGGRRRRRFTISRLPNIIPLFLFLFFIID